jgi:hypothetical protein
MEQPAAWWDAVDEMAAKAGVERSTWLYNVAIEKMPKRLAAKIPYRPKRGRPKLKLPEN